jgi:hypothetical protein
MQDKRNKNGAHEEEAKDGFLFFCNANVLTIRLQCAVRLVKIRMYDVYVSRTHKHIFAWIKEGTNHEETVVVGGFYNADGGCMQPFIARIRGTDDQHLCG